MVKTSPSTTIFRLPNLEEMFSCFPGGQMNPHHHTAEQESRLWISQYNKGVYGPKMTAFMDRCKFELLSSYAYPYASQARLRAMMDLHNVFWLYDEATDVQSGEQAKAAAQTVRRAFTDMTFSDGSWLCRMLQDFRSRHLDGVTSPAFTQRFIEHFCSYADHVGDEAARREDNEILDIPSYLEFRRESAAVRVVLDTAEYCTEIELPNYVLEDPVFKIGYVAALDIILATNDIHSFNMEQSNGHAAANLITVIRKARDLDIQGASDYAGGFCEALLTQFLQVRSLLAARSDPAFAQDAVKVMDGIGFFIEGHERWGFASERFFGKQNTIARKTRVIELREPFAEHVELNE